MLFSFTISTLLLSPSIISHAFLLVLSHFSLIIFFKISISFGMQSKWDWEFDWRTKVGWEEVFRYYNHCIFVFILFNKQCSFAITNRFGYIFQITYLWLFLYSTAFTTSLAFFQWNDDVLNSFSWFQVVFVSSFWGNWIYLVADLQVWFSD